VLGRTHTHTHAHTHTHTHTHAHAHIHTHTHTHTYTHIHTHTCTHAHTCFQVRPSRLRALTSSPCTYLRRTLAPSLSPHVCTLLTQAQSVIEAPYRQELHAKVHVRKWHKRLLYETGCGYMVSPPPDHRTPLPRLPPPPHLLPIPPPPVSFAPSPIGTAHQSLHCYSTQANWSTTPNVYCKTVRLNEVIVLQTMIALRDIKAYEEVTSDYRNQESKTFRNT
jgi:hypothetical protein